jgi:hypothetical protein
MFARNPYGLDVLSGEKVALGKNNTAGLAGGKA